MANHYNTDLVNTILVIVRMYQSLSSWTKNWLKVDLRKLEQQPLTLVETPKLGSGSCNKVYAEAIRRECFLRA